MENELTVTFSFFWTNFLALSFHLSNLNFPTINATRWISDPQHYLFRPDPFFPIYKYSFKFTFTSLRSLNLQTSQKLSQFFVFFKLSSSSSMESSTNLAATAPIRKESIARKKSSKGSKGSSSSADQEPLLRDTTQLFSLNPLDYDDSIRIMIEFLAHHPLSNPLTKIPDPPLHLSHIHRAFNSIKLEDDVLLNFLLDDLPIPVYKATFHRAIGISPNAPGFKVLEPTAEEFHTFLNFKWYTQDYREKDFKKTAVSGLWTVLSTLR